MNKAMFPNLAERFTRAEDTPAAAAPSAGRTQPQAKSRAGADEIVGLPGALLDGSAQAGTQTLLRGLAILEAAAAGVRDLRSFGAVLGTTRSTTHRLVSSLVQARYLRQVQGGYLLGPKLIELGTIALEQ
ncbi:MAG TPA: helix-turn-helix domain-containing protein, partial [Paraburkholderia sp.]|nr:helix-turn-helix domain-containing protein [Paraburkholderia sp.]